jgi:small subunit ribosomal protein S9
MAKPLIQATGRRKESVARVRFKDGSGQVTLNGKPLETYFPSMAVRMRVMEPLSLTQTQGRYDIDATLNGGGTTGQADALRLAISRALVTMARPSSAQTACAGRPDLISPQTWLWRSVAPLAHT